MQIFKEKNNKIYRSWYGEPLQVGRVFGCIIRAGVSEVVPLKLLFVGSLSVVHVDIAIDKISPITNYKATEETYN